MRGIVYILIILFFSCAYKKDPYDKRYDLGFKRSAAIATSTKEDDFYKDDSIPIKIFSYPYRLRLRIAPDVYITTNKEWHIRDGRFQNNMCDSITINGYKIKVTKVE